MSKKWRGCLRNIVLQAMYHYPHVYVFKGIPGSYPSGSSGFSNHFSLCKACYWHRQKECTYKTLSYTSLKGQSGNLYFWKYCCRDTQNVRSSNTNFSTMHQRVYNTWYFYSVRKRNPDLNPITKYPKWFKILPRSRKVWPKEIFWREFSKTAHRWVHAFWYWPKSVSR